MDPRDGLDGCGKSPPGIRSLDRPVRSESLCRRAIRENTATIFNPSSNHVVFTDLTPGVKTEWK